MSIRPFFFISLNSLNWRGEPLLNCETIIDLIGGTHTRRCLKGKAVLDTNQYGASVCQRRLWSRLRRQKGAKCDRFKPELTLYNAFD